MVAEPAGEVGRGGGGGVDGVPEGEGGAEGFFVGGYDADAGLEESRVGVREGLGACVVDQDGGAAGEVG